MNSGGGKKQYDHLIKLIIIGDSSVGKSCILLRFSEDHFPTSHMPTIGKSICSYSATLQFAWRELLTSTNERLVLSCWQQIFACVL